MGGTYTRRRALTMALGTLLLTGCGAGTPLGAAAPATPASAQSGATPPMTGELGPRLTAPAVSPAATPASAAPAVGQIATVVAAPTSDGAMLPRLPGLLDAGLGAGTLSAGSVAPAFTLPDASGKLVDLASLRGRASVLNFFASTCAPCAAELLLLAAVQRRYGRTMRTVLIGVMAAPADLMPSMTANGGATLRALADQRGTAARAYHGSLVPTTVVLDGRGRIAATHVGELAPASLTVALAKAGVAAAGRAAPTLPMPAVPAAGPAGCCALPWATERKRETNDRVEPQNGPYRALGADDRPGRA